MFKDKAVRFWNWEGLDYMIQITIILVLIAGNLKVLGAKNTLKQNGCKAYWNQYQDVNLTRVTFYNRTEAKYARAGKLDELNSDTKVRSDLQLPDGG